ncbi:MAG: C25 family cysteine peptidase [Pirellula sp.]
MNRLAVVLALANSVSLSFTSRVTSGQSIAQSMPALPTVIVVRPSDWHGKLEEWNSYRSVDYQLQFIDSTANPYLLRNAVLDAVNKAGSPVEAIVLCGDVAEPPANLKGANPTRPITPTFSLDTNVKLGQLQTPTLVTDALYGDIDDDGCPDIPVGRLPAKNAEELRRMLGRSIAYERSTDVGLWRDQVHVTAGVGGFGMLADAAIESVARRYLTEGIPDRFQLQMTYASLTSPYCPDPTKLKDAFLSRVNRGGMFWVYIGHGWIDCLDRFTYGKTEELICSAEDAKRFSSPNGPPIAVLLACYTGAFDAKVDCFAERLLQQPDGPIAVIAGSRVTMPYGLSQLAGEMLESCFIERTDTLGKIVGDAKKATWLDATDASQVRSNSESSTAKLKSKYQSAIEQMAKSLSPPDHSLVGERREHVRLMNLLGDPLLKIRHPHAIDLKSAETVDAGSTISASFVAPWSGKARIELYLNRDRLPTDLVSIGNYTGTIEQHTQMQSNYENANQLQLWSQELDVNQGKCAFEVPITGEMRGKYVLRVRMQSANDWAIGAKRITVRRVKDLR